MPRNSSTGVYAQPSGTVVFTGEVIDPVAWNEVVSDIGNELTASLPVAGEAPMIGPLKLAAGTALAPGLTFALDPSSGLHRVAPGVLAVAITGSDALTINSTGIAAPAILKNANNIDQWEVVYDQDQTSATAMQITGLSAYESLRIKWWAYPVSGTTQWLYARVGNGGTMVAGANAYQNTSIYQVEGSSTVTGYTTSSTVIEASLNNTLPLNNVYGNVWNVEVSQFNKAVQTRLQGHITFFNGSNILHGTVSHREATPAARDSLHFSSNGDAMPFTGHLFIEGKRG